VIELFIRHGITYTALGLLTRVLSYLLLPLYTLLLSPSDFGAVDMLTAFSTVLIVCVSLEINQALARMCHESKSLEQRRTVISTAFWFTLGTFSLCTIVIIFFRQFVTSTLLGPTESPEIIYFFAPYIFSNGIFLLFQCYARYSLKTFQFACVSFIFNSVSIASCLVLVLACGLRSAGILLGLTIGQIVASLIGYWLAKQDILLRFDKKKLYEMLKFSIPLLPSSLGIIALLVIDKFTIGLFLSLEEVGVYGVTSRVAAMTGIIIFGVNSALSPLIYATYKDESTPHSIATIFRFYVFGGSLLVIGLSTFAPEVMTLLVDPKFHQGAPLLAPLTITLLLAPLHQFAPGLVLAKKTMTISCLNLSIALLTMALILLLIPKFGVLGVALATLTGNLLGAAINMNIANRYYFVPFEWKRVQLTGILTGLLVILMASQVLENWKIEIAVVSVIVVAAVTFKTGDIRQGRLLLRRIFDAWYCKRNRF